MAIKVNDQVIPSWAIERQAQSLYEQVARGMQGKPQEVIQLAAIDLAKERMIDQSLMAQESNRRKYQIDPEEVNKGMKRWMRENGGKKAIEKAKHPAIKDRDEVIGNQTRVKVVKNKVAPPFRVIEFDILYGEGISKTGELIDLGVKAGVVEKSGSWYSYGPQRIGQGKENARSFLAENPDVADEIETKIRSDAGLIDIEALTQDEAKMAEGQDEAPEEPPAEEAAGG